ncbi:hypothetical protein [Acetobacter papayae]|uniref:hypothetical protein n=1 Tax=Acetobacter papayae TaxID=1076592 RepID=UPI00131EEA19|nr:hypothetical protein [Acetobacter papayae]
MTVSRSGASTASPTPNWLTADYARRILGAIAFPGDGPPTAPLSPDATTREATS